MSFLRSSFFKLPQYKKFDYKPIYFDDEAEAKRKRKEQRLEKGSFERGSFYKSQSTLAGAFTEKEFAFRSRHNKGSQFMRTVLLTIMMFAIFAYFMGKLPSVVAIGTVLICLIVFVKNVNKM